MSEKVQEERNTFAKMTLWEHQILNAFIGQVMALKRAGFDDENSNISDEAKLRLQNIYQGSLEQMQARLGHIFTPEELAKMGRRDFSKLELPGKPLSEMINEDREDRF